MAEQTKEAIQMLLSYLGLRAEVPPNPARGAHTGQQGKFLSESKGLRTRKASSVSPSARVEEDQGPCSAVRQREKILPSSTFLF